MRERKRRKSWRVCPACKSRATKLFSLSDGRYTCQVCGHRYAPDDAPAVSS